MRMSGWFAPSIGRRPLARHDAAMTSGVGDPSSGRPSRVGRNAGAANNNGIGTIFYPALLMFKANMQSRQRRAWAGYLWLVLPGAAIALAFSLLRRGELFVTGPIPLPYPVFALSGVFLWQCFTDGLTGPLQNLARERHILAVTATPHGAILLAGLLENLFALAVRMALLLAVLFAFGVEADLAWLLVPLMAVLMLLVGFGFGLLLSPVGQLYDDIGSLLAIASAFGLFVLPVIFPIPATSLLAWNPLVAVVDTAHAWMAGATAPHLPWVAAALAAILLPAGWVVVDRARPHIAARA